MAARRRSARAPRGPVVLLTDFGSGYFQGVMKGVILKRAPSVQIVDLDHHVPPGAVLQGAYVLESAADHFPDASVFCCVVDPGVGTVRRRLVVEVPDGPLAVGPDNGLLTALIRRSGAIAREITNRRWFTDDDTRTFEGRSRFAPAAAMLAAGESPRDAGPVVGDAIVLSGLSARIRSGRLEGGVIYEDSFGNLVTSVRARDLDGLRKNGARLAASVGPRRDIPLRATYGDVADGEVLAYVGSTGHLEIAVRGGNAARALGAGVGDPVQVRAAGKGRR